MIVISVKCYGVVVLLLAVCLCPVAILDLGPVHHQNPPTHNLHHLTPTTPTATLFLQVWADAQQQAHRRPDAVVVRFTAVIT